MRSASVYFVIIVDGNAPIVAAQLYIAGTETTSTALNWAVLYTCLHPDVMRRVQEEIDSQIGRFLSDTLTVIQFIS